MKTSHFRKVSSAVVLSAMLLSCAFREQSRTLVSDDSLAVEEELIEEESEVIEAVYKEEKILGLDKLTWEEQAYQLVFKDDTVLQNAYGHEKVEGNFVMLPWGMSNKRTENILENATVCLFGMNVPTDEEVMYPTVCPTLAVFTTDDEDRAGLVASLSLECFTNYDDTMTSISLENLSLSDSIDFIAITSRSQSISGESEGTTSYLFLYAIDGDELVEVNRFELEVSESDEETRKTFQSVITPLESKTLGVPDLKVETRTEDDGEITKGEVRYVWNGEMFVEKSNQ